MTNLQQRICKELLTLCRSYGFENFYTFKTINERLGIRKEEFFGDNNKTEEDFFYWILRFLGQDGDGLIELTPKSVRLDRANFEKMAERLHIEDPKTRDAFVDGAKWAKWAIENDVELDDAAIESQAQDYEGF